jgi:hypothetical protein
VIVVGHRNVATADKEKSLLGDDERAAGTTVDGASGNDGKQEK